MQGQIIKLHNLMFKKQVSSKEIVQKYLNTIYKKDKTINSFITMTEREALLAATELDRHIFGGGTISYLAGIPMSVKDNICIKDIRATCGSKMLSSFVPKYTATACDMLLKNKALLLGKTNMDEFAMGSTGESSYFGPCLNPIDETRVPGGSSSGSAASVAADMAVFSVGTDTGGSVRLPASYCGLVGFKPTYGAISRYGLISYASSFDQMGIFSKSVEDAAIVYDVMSSPDKKDSTMCLSKNASTYDFLKKDIKGTRIGVDFNLIKKASIDVQKNVLKSIKVFESLGAHICEITLPDAETVLSAYYVIACAEAASNLSRYDGVRFGYRTPHYDDFDDMAKKSRTEAFGDEVKKRIMLGNLVLSTGYHDKYYHNAIVAKNDIKAKISDIFKDVDIILTPTSPDVAPELHKSKPSFEDMYLLDLYTVLANVCSLPAISIPCGYNKCNLPVGIELVSNLFTEGKLLNVSYMFEDALGGGMDE